MRFTCDSSLVPLPLGIYNLAVNSVLYTTAQWSFWVSLWITWFLTGGIELRNVWEKPKNNRWMDQPKWIFYLCYSHKASPTLAHGALTAGEGVQDANRGSWTEDFQVHFWAVFTGLHGHRGDKFRQSWFRASMQIALLSPLLPHITPYGVELLHCTSGQMVKLQQRCFLTHKSACARDTKHQNHLFYLLQWVWRQRARNTSHSAETPCCWALPCVGWSVLHQHVDRWHDACWRSLWPWQGTSDARRPCQAPTPLLHSLCSACCQYMGTFT